METWVAVFVTIAAVALVLQTLLLFAMYQQIRRFTAALTLIAANIDARLSPILSRIHRFLEDSHGHMSEIVADTAEIVRLVKSNGKKVDRLMDEATDRLRVQIVHADRLLTGALEAIEDASSELRKSVVEPVRHATALIQGVKAGIEFFRGRKRMPERRRESEDEGLFI